MVSMENGRDKVETGDISNPSLKVGGEYGAQKEVRAAHAKQDLCFLGTVQYFPAASLGVSSDNASRNVLFHSISVDIWPPNIRRLGFV